MLQFNQLSYWERKYFLDSIDFVILGSGIVGLTCALQLKTKFSKAKILILERGYIPTGASTKNAGFACFGSPSEILDDLEKIDESTVWETVQLRYQGLKRLIDLTGKTEIGFKNCGSWELFNNDDVSVSLDQINWLNSNLKRLTNEDCTYAFDNDAIINNGLTGFTTAIKNRLEGSIRTDLLMSRLISLAVSKGILILNGINIKEFNSYHSNVEIESNFGRIESSKLIICTNGFAKNLIPEINVTPSRAQVLITKPISDLKLKGTFHSKQGYYYFRNIGNRILLGGARCIDLIGENDEKFQNTDIIKNELIRFLSNHFDKKYESKIDYFWSGIMGTGSEKKPIVLQLNKNVYCGVRMGGMGIAIGSEIGSQLVKLVSNG